MTDFSGKQLGQYSVVGVIGQGGMATVYRAHQETMDRDVAIKVITGQLASNPSFIARFERETRLIAKLQHPHILPVYDFGRDGEQVYLVMRLVEGGSLDVRLEGGALPLDKAAQMFTQIASAMTYAHNRGIIHRDMKPNNILLDSEDNSYLTDFGIAKMVAANTHLTASGAVMGTPAYMAPEQWRSEDIDARADIYSLGIMLYEMLTGKLPFNSETPFGMMYKHLDTMPPPPNLVNPHIPEAVGKVINRSIAKRREDRYATADDMARDLNAAISGHQSGVTPSEMLELIDFDDADAHLPVASTESGVTSALEATNIGLARPPFVAASLPPAPLPILATQASAPTIPPVSATPVSAPAKNGGLPLLAIVAALVILILIVGGGLLFASQSASQTAATSTSVAFANMSTGTSVAAANNTATVIEGTRVAVLSTNAVVVVLQTQTAVAQTVIAAVTATNTPSATVTATVSATTTPSPIPSDPPTLSPTAVPLSATSTASAVPTTVIPDTATSAPTTEASPTTDAQSIATTAVAATIMTMPLTLTPTIIAATPTPLPPFVTPQGYQLGKSSTLRISFTYPRGWKSELKNASFLIQPPSSNVSIDGAIHPDPKHPFPDAYVLFQRKGHDTLTLPPAGSSLIDLFHANLGQFAENPVPVDGAPFPAVYGRAKGIGSGLPVNGWLALVTLDEGNVLFITAQALPGKEQEFLDTIVVPIIRSLEYPYRGS